MKRLELHAKLRTIFGKKLRSLRKQGVIPGNVFGKKTASQALSLDGKELKKVYEEAGETSLVDLTIEGEQKPRPVLFSNLHLNPVTDAILHVDLHQVDLKTKTTAEVPVEITGEAPAVKEQGGVLIVNRNEVEVEALPTDLPEKLAVDVTGLAEIGSTVTVADLKYDREKVTVLLEPEEIIVAIQEPAPVEEPTPAPEAETEGEAAPVEGEAPAEGTPSSEAAPKSE